MTDTPIAVLVADDHPVVRRGVAQLLVDSLPISRIGEASCASDVAALAREVPWDVVILDLNLGGRSGLDVLQQLKTERPKLPVLILSMYSEDQYAIRALRAGASGYITKEGAPDVLVDAVRRVVAGGRYISQGVADRLAAINEKAVNIGGVVTTITKVAEQTNLLSVNAAIEAEKAGEYGLGFLVVAREIRRLADQVGQATLDIERMVKEMQGAVSSGVMEMDRFSEQVRRNVGDVRSIGRSMTEIIGSVDEAGKSFGTVREGMRSQAAGAGQISEAMATLSTNAKATAEAVKEFGRASEDLQRSIGLLKTAIAAFQLRA